MIVLGLSGGPDLVHENLFGLTPYQAHDSACALVEDGEALFAIEEERLNRIKHTNKFPSQAIRFCLEGRGVGIEDVDLIAYYSCEEIIDLSAKKMFLASSQAPILHNSVSLIQYLIGREFPGDVPAGKLRFIHHHHAHAMSAYAMSGFEEALII
jgi:carbamoyltransferase